MTCGSSTDSNGDTKTPIEVSDSHFTATIEGTAVTTFVGTP